MGAGGCCQCSGFIFSQTLLRQKHRKKNTSYGEGADGRPHSGRAERTGDRFHRLLLLTLGILSLFTHHGAMMKVKYGSWHMCCSGTCWPLWFENHSPLLQPMTASLFVHGHTCAPHTHTHTDTLLITLSHLLALFINTQGSVQAVWNGLQPLLTTEEHHRELCLSRVLGWGFVCKLGTASWWRHSSITQDLRSGTQQTPILLWLCHFKNLALGTCLHLSRSQFPTCRKRGTPTWQGGWEGQRKWDSREATGNESAPLGHLHLLSPNQFY